MQQALPANVLDTKVEQINGYMAKARKIARMYIKLAEEAASETQCATLFMDSKACQMKGESGGDEHKSFVGIFIDIKRFGEASSNANLRIPAIKHGRLPTLFSIILQARSSMTGLQNGDLYFKMLDLS